MCSPFTVLRIWCSKYKHLLQRNVVFIFPQLQLIKIWVSWLTLSAPPLQICIPLHLSYGPAQSEYWFWKWAGNQYVGQFHFWPNWMWSEVVKILICFGNQWPVVYIYWDHNHSGHPSLQKWGHHSLHSSDRDTHSLQCYGHDILQCWGHHSS